MPLLHHSGLLLLLAHFLGTYPASLDLLHGILARLRKIFLGVNVGWTAGTMVTGISGDIHYNNYNNNIIINCFTLPIIVVILVGL